MARFYGAIGYGESAESPANSGVWKDVITEYSYYGDVVQVSSKRENGDGLNANVGVGNSISIVADQYAIDHFQAIRYIRWDGGLWTVTHVTVQPPRLIISLGEVYNGSLPGG